VCSSGRLVWVSEMSATFRLSWDLARGLQPQFANQFVTQVGGKVSGSNIPEGIFLTAGVVAPPIIIGDHPEEEIDRLKGVVEVQPVVKLLLTREHAGELSELLQTALRQFDAVVTAEPMDGARG
jgi:hypothetical protein